MEGSKAGRILVGWSRNRSDPREDREQTNFREIDSCDAVSSCLMEPVLVACHRGTLQMLLEEFLLE